MKQKNKFWLKVAWIFVFTLAFNGLMMAGWIIHELTHVAQATNTSSLCFEFGGKNIAYVVSDSVIGKEEREIQAQLVENIAYYTLEVILFLIFVFLLQNYWFKRQNKQ